MSVSDPGGPERPTGLDRLAEDDQTEWPVPEPVLPAGEDEGTSENDK